MSADRETTHEFPAEFSLEEMAWIRRDGTMDESLTELTALTDDTEFERQMFLLRLARQLADLNRTRSLYRQTKILAQRIQKLLAVLFSFFVRVADLFFRRFENLVQRLYAARSKTGIIRHP